MKRVVETWSRRKTIPSKRRVWRLFQSGKWVPDQLMVRYGLGNRAAGFPVEFNSDTYTVRMASPIVALRAFKQEPVKSGVRL